MFPQQDIFLWFICSTWSYICFRWNLLLKPIIPSFTAVSQEMENNANFLYKTYSCCCLTVHASYWFVEVYKLFNLYLTFSASYHVLQWRI
jgi:hypothetical protein